ncbi:HDOD domain-containing protein [Methylomicrobium sp. RS1]|jgi:putative nucleotidyltransferase with HDIG domain|uniref:HDOD domain-containing protein n=1 Tax=Candidatus Methylomicrobium oryzae TaxID=2802053 RepID=UPI001922BCC0|nr:HDOD domain-containing protein [Methylomicrobium sp. RS1]MBL1264654.1 HDOD domain-containing protein [Methylomicrobium sp. RS1]
MEAAEPLTTSSATGQSENKLLLVCYRHFEKNQLILPTIPEVAFKIRRVINDEKANSAKIARTMQADPSLTARLIKISNSALYRGRKTIESCPEAITRLGLKAVQDIITAFSLKSVFTAKSPFIRQRMVELWAHSSFVAAISAVLAHKAKGFDPDRAMLAGLIHDIGKIPILAFADQHIDLVANAAHLTETIDKLHGMIGLNIIRKWNFPDDFENVVLHSENWQRDTGEHLDYADIVMLAQFHSLIGKVDIKTLPKLDTLPAYQKIARRLDASGSLEILDIAKEEIEAIRQMLG